MTVPKADASTLHGAIALAASKLQNEPSSGTAKDPALFLLGSGIITRFQDAWERGIPANIVGDGKEVAPLKSIYGDDMTVQGFVEYMALELSTPLYGMSLEATKEKLSSVYDALRGYSEEDLAESLTALIDMSVVRGGLHAFITKNSRDIKQLDGIDPPAVRQNCVIAKFKEWFKENAALSFHFDTDFLQYVLTCFNDSFYPSAQKEIWDLLLKDPPSGVGKMNLK